MQTGQGSSRVLLSGMLVELPDRKGIGKLRQAADGRCAVLVFHSILRHERIELSLSDITRAYLSPQTRVYVREDDRYRIGRVTNYFVLESGLVDYEVRFPNGKQWDVGEVDLFVRPWNAPEDPAEILAAVGAESQFLHDQRQSAVEQLLKLRSAAQGLTSVISAGIDFVPHQIAAVRRVLTDPVQRYLLADEVGLGKTIEAGLIIRQHLIDNPETKILISAPSHLCAQWRSELIDKIRLDQFKNAFECCDHSDLVQITKQPDILVVDEAHHLVGVEFGPLLLAAEKLRNLALDASVLLLLSATPALNDEAKFLALLNLLDPLSHPLEDIAGFRAKLEKRREIGRLILSLDPRTPGLVLRQRGSELQRLFPDDPVVQDLAPKLISVARGASDEVAQICSALKEHIADSYRIHQRLIRSRRADAKGWEFMPRGLLDDQVPILTHVRVEDDPDPMVEPLLTAIEDWRFSALEARIGDEAALARLAWRYRSILAAVSIGADALKNRLEEFDVSFPDEEEILDSLKSIADQLDRRQRFRTMVDSTKRLVKTLKADAAEPKVVVFTSSEAEARAFKKEYELAPESSDVHLLTADVKHSDEVIRAFSQMRKSGILVTDRSGEEGLNLNFLDGIVHLDLPLSVEQIEQRIGRLDRFGRRQGIIRQRILLPSSDDASPWAAWYELLANGFMIFNRSISDVQFLIGSLEDQAFQILFQFGADGLVRFVAEVRDRIAEERKSQDEQYALDRIALAEQPIEEFIDALENAEEDENALERGVDRWLVGALQLKKRPFAWPEEDPFKLTATSQTLIPRAPWQVELRLENERPLTWRRRLTTNRPDVTLLRPGVPTIDAAERYTRWDDRGTAFITYRTVPDWSGDLWIGLKLCFVIEPRLEFSDLVAPTPGELAKARRAQRYFSARGYISFIDINGEAVTDNELISILKRPYHNETIGEFRQDINLGSRPQMLADIIDLAKFAQCCRFARDSARTHIVAQPEFIEEISRATQLATADLERCRNRWLRTGGAAQSAAVELIESTLPTIREPMIRLDSMGCFVISQHPPRRGFDD